MATNNSRSFIIGGAHGGVYAVTSTSGRSYILAPGLFLNEQDPPQGWRPTNPDVFAKRLPASQQQFSTTIRRPDVVVPQGWQATPGYIFTVELRGLDFDVSPSPPTQPVWPEGFFSNLFVRPLSVAQQQFSSFQALGTVIAPPPNGWWGRQLDHRFAKPFPAALQQFLARGRLPDPDPTADSNGWSSSFPDVVGTLDRKHEFSGLTRLPPSNTPPGWWQAVNPEIFKRAVGAWQQQYEARGLPSFTARPEGWQGQQLAARFAKPFSASQQQWAAFQARGSIFTVFPESWRGYQFNFQLAKQTPAALQQFLAFLQLREADPTNTPPGWWQGVNPERFARPFPTILQQYEARGLVPIIVVPPTPDTTNLPGHGDWPRHVKKLPKVRPIWDRRPDPIEEGSPKPGEDLSPLSPEGVPEEPTSTAKAPPGDGKDSPYLKRLLVPDPLAKPFSPPKAPRNARVTVEETDTAQAYGRAQVEARAELVDADDVSTSSGHVAVAGFALGVDSDESVTRRALARLEVTEEDDTLEAEAGWNDDEIALGLLLGDL